MTYNRDLQEDKEPLFDAVRTAEETLVCLAEFVPTLVFDEDRAAEMLEGGYLDATVMAEYLVEKGLPFREAHGVSGTLVRLAEEKKCRLSDLTLKEMTKVSSLFEKDIHKRLDPANTPKAYASAGSAGHKEIAKALRRWTRRLKA